jgi:outer membrane protein TolC
MAKRLHIAIAACICAPALFAADAPQGTDSQPVPAPNQQPTLCQKADFELIDFNRLQEIAETADGLKIVRMTLQECIQLALENNPDLQVVKYEPLKFGADALATRGEFDPLLSGQVSYSESLQAALTAPQTREQLLLRGLQTVSGGLQATAIGLQTAEQLLSLSANNVPTSSSVGQITSLFQSESELGTKSRNLTDRVSVTGTLHTGTVYDASLALNGDASPYGYSPWEWSGGLTLTVSQPLLRGRGNAVNTARIHIAENAAKTAESRVRLAVMSVVSDVIKAYWDLVGAFENVSVRGQALANAERLLDLSRKRLSIGSAARKEVLEAKAGVAMRQTDLANAQWQARNAENAVKALLNMRDNGVFSSARIVPIDRPGEDAFDPDIFKNQEEQVAKSIELALKNRPEMTVGDLEIKTSEIECRRTANELLPDLSITGSVFQGRHGYEWEGVLGGIVRRNDHSSAVGLVASVPLGNRSARGAAQRAGFTLKQAKQELERTKLNLMLKVRLATDAVRATRILVETNHQATQLQVANVAAEEESLRIGISTSYRVLLIQQDLALAQTQEVDARVEHEKALVELRFDEGTLLDSLGIDFASPGQEPPVVLKRDARPSAPETK